jgi:cell division protein ZapA
MSETNALNVTILDREFRVACPPDEQAELMAAVGYLDKKMREIADAGKVVSVERIAVMAALNIAHELLTTKLGVGFDIAEFKNRMQSMRSSIDDALAEQETLF